MNEQIPNILVVDDVVANLVILGDIIRNAGYIPRPVTSVVQAEKAISANLPQLILLDISMPDVDGFEFCKRLKSLPVTKDIPIIFISARNATQDKIRAFELGAVDFITKPFEMEEVTHRITTHLKLYSMQNQLESYNRKLNKIISQQVKVISESQEKIVFTLAKLIGMSRDELPSHMKRVGKLAKLIAMSLDCLDYTLDFDIRNFAHTIEIASYLHDIGKLAMEQEMFHRAGPLGFEEQCMMKKHSDIGEVILKEVLQVDKDNIYLKMALEIVNAHHEKWDGSGYPRKLSEEDIPLSARIVAVVDTYDILRSKRSYKEAYSHEESMEIINQGSGISFDPFIVKLFNQLESQFIKYYL